MRCVRRIGDVLTTVRIYGMSMATCALGAGGVPREYVQLDRVYDGTWLACCDAPLFLIQPPGANKNLMQLP